MMDSELKKSSVRANKLEKKRFEMMMSAFDSAKRNVAVDMKKSQLDFKRRLKRYKDRQREILVTRAGPSSSTMEEFVLKQLTRRNHIHPAPHNGRRPQTCPHPNKGNTTNLTLLRRSDATKAAQVTDSRLEQEEEEDEDLGKLSHCRRSKVDLRPCTAWSAVRSSRAKADSVTGTTRGTHSNVKLLQLRGGSLGTPARQVRYLDDEEIEERSTFYRFLLDGLRHIELERLESLNDRVEEFCGGKASGRQHSCPPLRKAVGLVSSLPAGVPPIIVQAMRVKIPSASLLGHMQSRAKTQ
ncbi:uncharacterized protein LOC143281737 [Babylonia areolata]|uniref:uncharacterized protein LOC143281737 n=1 Tax=Babylonia areolata TaxID=304850 RepID=UPI003FD56513